MQMLIRDGGRANSHTATNAAHSPHCGTLLTHIREPDCRRQRQHRDFWPDTTAAAAAEAAEDETKSEAGAGAAAQRVNDNAAAP